MTVGMLAYIAPFRIHAILISHGRYALQSIFAEGRHQILHLGRVWLFSEYVHISPS